MVNSLISARRKTTAPLVIAEIGISCFSTLPRRSEAKTKTKKPKILKARDQSYQTLCHTLQMRSKRSLPQSLLQCRQLDRIHDQNTAVMSLMHSSFRLDSHRYPQSTGPF